MFSLLNRQRNITTASQFAKYILVCRLLKTIKTMCFIGLFTSLGYDFLGLSSGFALVLVGAPAALLLTMDLLFHFTFLAKIKREGEAIHTAPFSVSINELYKSKAVKATDVGLSKFLGGVKNA